MTEKKKRNRLGNLMKPMGVARAHAQVIREMFNAGPGFDWTGATRKSQALQGQRNILETTEVETRMGKLEEMLERIALAENRSVVQFKKPA